MQISHALDMPPGPDAERFVSELLGVLTGEELDAAQQDEQVRVCASGGGWYNSIRCSGGIGL
jgi:hypothetical protein